ncbi:uncharacterized protein LOC141912911 [Tubulanus polymorphus]|uniref:uncharacterized protein LOC141912911 n=1 Tax=Tubulanus polymorphus TaxID=672921 RepID=UPI003DA27C7E
MDEIRSLWEVPCVAHFCSLFQAVFELPEFDIDELEEGLLAAGGSVDGGGSPLVNSVICRLLNGCYARNDISEENFAPFLREVLNEYWEFEMKYPSPLNDETPEFYQLPVNVKIQVLHLLCNVRLYGEDVSDLTKDLDADSLRVEPLGIDRNGSTYWYFYGTRLYRDNPSVKTLKKREKKQERLRKQKEKERIRKEKEQRRKQRRAERRAEKKAREERKKLEREKKRKNKKRQSLAETAETPTTKKRRGRPPKSAKKPDETQQQTVADAKSTAKKRGRPRKRKLIETPPDSEPESDNASADENGEENMEDDDDVDDESVQTDKSESDEESSDENLPLSQLTKHESDEDNDNDDDDDNGDDEDEEMMMTPVSVSRRRMGKMKPRLTASRVKSIEELEDAKAAGIDLNEQTEDNGTNTVDTVESSDRTLRTRAQKKYTEEEVDVDDVDGVGDEIKTEDKNTAEEEDSAVTKVEDEIGVKKEESVSVENSFKPKEEDAKIEKDVKSEEKIGDELKSEKDEEVESNVGKSDDAKKDKDGDDDVPILQKLMSEFKSDDANAAECKKDAKDGVGDVAGDGDNVIERENDSQNAVDDVEGNRENVDQCKNESKDVAEDVENMEVDATPEEEMDNEAVVAAVKDEDPMETTVTESLCDESLDGVSSQVSRESATRRSRRARTYVLGTPVKDDDDGDDDDGDDNDAGSYPLRSKRVRRTPRKFGFSTPDKELVARATKRSKRTEKQPESEVDEDDANDHAVNDEEEDVGARLADATFAIDFDSFKKWEIVCDRLDEWQTFADSIKGSRVRCEKSLHKIIVNNFLPEIPQLEDQKRRAHVRHLTEEIGSRKSSRIEKKSKEKEEQEKKIDDEKRRREEEERLEQQRFLKEEKERERDRMREERELRLKLREERAALIREGKEIPPELMNVSTGKYATTPRNRLPSDSPELDDMILCMFKIFDIVRKHEDAWLFSEPITEEWAPGYHDIIKDPIDMIDIETKLSAKDYRCRDDFVDDFKLMFSNCRKYNANNQEALKMCTKVAKQFYRTLKRELPTSDTSNDDEDYFTRAPVVASSAKPRPSRVASNRAKETLHQVTTALRKRSMSPEERRGGGTPSQFLSPLTQRMMAAARKKAVILTSASNSLKTDVKTNATVDDKEATALKMEHMHKWLYTRRRLPGHCMTPTNNEEEDFDKPSAATSDADPQTTTATTTTPNVIKVKRLPRYSIVRAPGQPIFHSPSLTRKQNLVKQYLKQELYRGAGPKQHNWSPGGSTADDSQSDDENGTTVKRGQVPSADEVLPRLPKPPVVNAAKPAAASSTATSSAAANAELVPYQLQTPHGILTVHAKPGMDPDSLKRTLVFKDEQIKDIIARNLKVMIKISNANLPKKPAVAPRSIATAPNRIPAPSSSVVNPIVASSRPVSSAVTGVVAGSPLVSAIPVVNAGLNTTGVNASLNTAAVNTALNVVNTNQAASSCLSPIRVITVQNRVTGQLSGQIVRSSSAVVNPQPQQPAMIVSPQVLSQAVSLATSNQAALPLQTVAANAFVSTPVAQTNSVLVPILATQQQQTGVVVSQTLVNQSPSLADVNKLTNNANISFFNSIPAVGGATGENLNIRYVGAYGEQANNNQNLVGAAVQNITINTGAGAVPISFGSASTQNIVNIGLQNIAVNSTQQNLVAGAAQLENISLNNTGGGGATTTQNLLQNITLNTVSAAPRLENFSAVNMVPVQVSSSLTDVVTMAAATAGVTTATTNGLHLEHQEAALGVQDTAISRSDNDGDARANGVAEQTTAASVQKLLGLSNQNPQELDPGPVIGVDDVTTS